MGTPVDAEGDCEVAIVVAVPAVVRNWGQVVSEVASDLPRDRAHSESFCEVAATVL